LQRFFGSAGQGETKLASAVVVHPEVERPEASMIGNLAAVRDLRENISVGRVFGH